MDVKSYIIFGPEHVQGPLTSNMSGEQCSPCCLSLLSGLRVQSISWQSPVPHVIIQFTEVNYNYWL